MKKSASRRAFDRFCRELDKDYPLDDEEKGILLATWQEGVAWATTYAKNHDLKAATGRQKNGIEDR